MDVPEWRCGRMSKFTLWRLIILITQDKSGLLAAVAAQLLSFFKSSDNFKRYHASQGIQNFIVAACYAALFLNIGATITSFILIDNLGEIGYQAACKQSGTVQNAGLLTAHQDRLLVIYGASPMWKLMLFYCEYFSWFKV